MPSSGAKQFISAVRTVVPATEHQAQPLVSVCFLLFDRLETFACFSRARLDDTNANLIIFDRKKRSTCFLSLGAIP